MSIEDIKRGTPTIPSEGRTYYVPDGQTLATVIGEKRLALSEFWHDRLRPAACAVLPTVLSALSAAKDRLDDRYKRSPWDLGQNNHRYTPPLTKLASTIIATAEEPAPRANTSSWRLSPTIRAALHSINTARTTTSQEYQPTYRGFLPAPLEATMSNETGETLKYAMQFHLDRHGERMLMIVKGTSEGRTVYVFPTSNSFKPHRPYSYSLPSEEKGAQSIFPADITIPVGSQIKHVSYSEYQRMHSDITDLSSQLEAQDPDYIQKINTFLSKAGQLIPYDSASLADTDRISSPPSRDARDVSAALTLATPQPIPAIQPSKQAAEMVVERLVRIGSLADLVASRRILTREPSHISNAFSEEQLSVIERDVRDRVITSWGVREALGLFRTELDRLNSEKGRDNRLIAQVTRVIDDSCVLLWHVLRFEEALGYGIKKSVISSPKPPLTAQPHSPMRESAGIHAPQERVPRVTNLRTMPTINKFDPLLAISGLSEREAAFRLRELHNWMSTNGYSFDPSRGFKSSYTSLSDSQRKRFDEEFNKKNF